MAEDMRERANGQLGIVVEDDTTAAASNLVRYLNIPKVGLKGPLAYEEGLRVTVTNINGEVIAEAVLEVGGYAVAKKVTEAGTYTELTVKAVDPA